jgi:predicted nucleic acid-binding protein
MVIVDSSVWIDAFNGQMTPQTRWLRSSLARGEVGLTSLILCEVLRGFRSDREFRETKEHLLLLPVLESTSADMAIKAAENFRILQRRGITVRKTVDCLIATLCIEEGHELLHHDNDFQGFENFLGLQVVHPQS